MLATQQFHSKDLQKVNHVLSQADASEGGRELLELMFSIEKELSPWDEYNKLSRRDQILRLVVRTYDLVGS
jgi:hypothetical protein